MNERYFNLSDIKKKTPPCESITRCSATKHKGNLVS